MPAKNVLKTYIAPGYYHVYNRGVDKREIFLDEDDCKIFLYYLKIYLSSPDELLKEYQSPRTVHKILSFNLFNEIDLLSFALMPNHFHLQVKQLKTDSIQKLMKRLCTAYVQYFNRKYRRKGPLFESTYKGVLSLTEEQHLYLSSYIHRNAMKLKSSKFDFVQFSSYSYYLGEKQTKWLKPDEILLCFKAKRGINNIFSYQNFVESFLEKPEEILGNLRLEEDD